MVMEKSISLQNSIGMLELEAGASYDVRSDVLCSIGTEKAGAIAATLCGGTSTCIAIISEKEGSVN